MIIQGAGKWSSPLVEYKTVYQVSLVNPTLWDTLSGSVTNHLHIRVDVFVGHLPENYLNPLKPETYYYCGFLIHNANLTTEIKSSTSAIHTTNNKWLMCLILWLILVP